MKKFHIENLFFILSLIASALVIIYLVPYTIDNSQKAPVEIVREEEYNDFTLITPDSTGTVRVKSSGIEITPEEEARAKELIAKFRARRENQSFSPLVNQANNNFSNLSENTPIHYHFSVSPELQPMVDFWTAVFGVYGKGEYIFYNKNNVGAVYSVIDLSSFLDQYKNNNENNEFEELKKKVIAEEKSRLVLALQELRNKIITSVPLTSEEERLSLLFQNNGLSLADSANADDIGVQEGFSSRFKEAIAQSGMYMDEMERIFTTVGIPIELTRLPFIESAFTTTALSSVGAKGLWQLMPDTGRLYLHVDDIADERLDPILSTQAAALHLKNDFDLLGSWELAVNAYNTGGGRIQKAKEQLHTSDIATIIKNFDDPNYQFYSRNYYPEFLAALNVYENQDHFFGKIRKVAPVYTESFYTPAEVNLKNLAEQLDVSIDVLDSLNPALSETVLKGEKNLPQGTFVRVPPGTKQAFLTMAVDPSIRN